MCDSPEHTATIRKVTRRRGVFLLIAECDRCGRRVTHGGGVDRATIGDYLGARVPHCACRGDYELVDPDQLINHPWMDGR